MSIKKLFVLGVVLLGVVVMFGATSPAYAATYEGCTISSFTRPLAQGMSGQDVKCLQVILNSDPETQLAVSGAGAPGNETTYFGPITKAAVIKFQEKYAPDILAVYGLTNGTGYVGKTTLAKLNSLLSGSTVTPPSTTKKAASEITDPVECVTAGYLWNGTCYEEGAEKKAAKDITDPTECVNAGYYWGAEGCYEEEKTAPSEGVITAEYNPEPINNQTLYAAETDKALVGVKIKAKDSDMTIKRMDVVFASTGASPADVVPWKYLTAVSVYHGDTLLQKMDGLTSDDFIKDSTGVYRLRFSGLDLEVAKDATEIVTVKVTTAPVLTANYTGINVYIPQSGIRGVDTLGLNQYAPDGDLSARTFDVNQESIGAAGVTQNVNSPKEGMQLISDTAGTITNDVDLLDFDVKATNQDVTLTDVTVGMHYTSIDDIASVNLYNGSTLLASESPAATVDFTDLSIAVSKDSTVTLSVKANVNPDDGSHTSEGDIISADVTSVLGNDANDNAVTATGVPVSGKDIHLYSAAPEIALYGTPTFEVTHNYDASTSDEALATIQFTATAKGSDIYIKDAVTENAISHGVDFVVTSAGTGASTNSGILSSDADETSGYYEILKGETKTFTLKVNVGSITTASDWFHVAIDNIDWNTTASNTGTSDTSWGLEKFVTPDIFLHIAG